MREDNSVYINKKAVALQYDGGNDAPVVTAAGMGYLADRIIKEASENDVPIVYNKELTDLMYNVNIGDEIPSELYNVAAEVIAFITTLDQKNKKIV